MSHLIHGVFLFSCCSISCCPLAHWPNSQPHVSSRLLRWCLPSVTVDISSTLTYGHYAHYLLYTLAQEGPLAKGVASVAGRTEWVLRCSVAGGMWWLWPPNQAPRGQSPLFNGLLPPSNKVASDLSQTAFLAGASDNLRCIGINSTSC